MEDGVKRRPAIKLDVSSMAVQVETHTLFDSSTPVTEVIPRPPKRFIDTSPRKPIKRKKKEKAGKMASFVFFDIESTGLFKLNGPRETSPMDDPTKIANRLHRYIIQTPQSARPHMTEVSFVCVSRRTFENTIEKMKKKASGDSYDMTETDLRCLIPANVHTRQLKPSLTEEEWKGYEDTRRPETHRLTRSVLSEKATFSDEWKGLRHVLETAPKPTCIVAHNGLGFDLRVLHAELERAELLNDGWLPDDVFFVDSLLAFREIDKLDTAHISALVEGIDWNAMILVRPFATVNIPQCIMEEDDVVAETPEEVQLAPLPFCGRSTYTTPTKLPPPVSTTSAPAKLNASRALFPAVSLDPHHPLHFLRSEEWTVAKRKRIQQQAFKRVNGKWQYDANTVADLANKRGLFRQENIYSTIFAHPYAAHQAQDDCEALMQICLAYGNSFLEYADTMAADIIY